MEKIEINIGESGWTVISFAAGCFGFGWTPFLIITVLSIIKGLIKEDK